jgi:hypothetical protein
MHSGDGKRALVVAVLLVLVAALVFLIWDRSFRQATALPRNLVSVSRSSGIARSLG